MTDPTSRLIGDVLHFASPILELIARARLFPPSDTVSYLLPEQAKSAVYAFLSHTASAEELKAWARFLLGRRDVAFAHGHEAELLELLEDISFSSDEVPFGPLEAETWVTRLDMSF